MKATSTILRTDEYEVENQLDVFYHQDMISI